jgi:predicted hotdog family 3-hydroxylacyl-ACP dehydratase
MEALYKDEQIFELIPQRPPMVMVDTFFGIHDGVSLSGLTVKEDNIFCKNGVLHESGIIEHIAQSAAARAGYIFVRNNEAVPVGFIGSVDKLVIRFLPQTGGQLRTQISILQQLGDITMVNADVKMNEELVANCRMKIFLQKE